MTEWHPITEIVRNCDVLLYGPETKFSAVKYRLGYYDSESDQFVWYGDFDDLDMWNPTHWCYLPASPEVKQ